MKHNGPGVKGRKTAPPLSEDNKLRILELRATGLEGKQIALETGVPVQTVRKWLRENGVSGRIRHPYPSSVMDENGNTLVHAQEIQGSTPEQLAALVEKRKALLKPAQPTELATRPSSEIEATKRTEDLGYDILRGAERLIKSINSMSDEALSAASLQQKATALGILVDKLRVITNKAQPMFGADATTVNIVNIIASAAPPRKKDQPHQAEDAEIIND